MSTKDLHEVQSPKTFVYTDGEIKRAIAILSDEKTRKRARTLSPLSYRQLRTAMSGENAVANNTWKKE